VVTNFDKNWDSQVRRHMRLPALEEKLTAYFQQVVRIFLPRDILNLCETPNQLIEYVGYTSSVIRLPQCDRNEMKMKTNPRLKKRNTPLHYHLHNFVMSRIPSDIYKVRNPGLDIEKDPKTNQLVIIQKKSKRLTEAVKFGFVTHQHVSSSDRTPVNPKTTVNGNLVQAEELQRLADNADFED